MGIFKRLKEIEKPALPQEKFDASESRVDFLQTVMKYQRDAYDAKEELSRLALQQVARG